METRSIISLAFFSETTTLSLHYGSLAHHSGSIFTILALHLRKSQNSFAFSILADHKKVVTSVETSQGTARKLPA